MKMTEKYHICTLNEQDKLEEGLIKTAKGVYLNLENLVIKIEDSDYRIPKISEQNKLDESLIKISRSGVDFYIPFGKLVESETYSSAETNQDVTSSQNKKKDMLTLLLVGGTFVLMAITGIIQTVRSESLECYIASTVYGDKNAYQLQILRDIRDNTLRKNFLGNILVNIYYRGVGKRTACIIETYLPSSKSIIKKGLDFIVEKYK